MKIKKSYYLLEDTISFIEDEAKALGIKPSHLIKRWVDEKKNQKNDQLELIKQAVKEVVAEDLGRIRAGTNLTDKHTQMLLEMANHFYAANQYKIKFVSTEIHKSPGIIESERVVKERITTARLKKLEREKVKHE